MKSLIRAGAIALATLLSPLAPLAEAHGIEITGAYALSSNPKVGAAFMVIENAGHPDRIVAAASPVSAKAELHTHIMEDGVAKMREVEGGIELPEKSTVKLERGGLHIMLMGLKAPLKEGETFPITLTLESGYDITVEVKVGSPGADKPMDHGTHHQAPATTSP